jgi:hypothetical protein
MLRLFFGFLLTITSSIAKAQLYSMAVGVYSGFTVPFSVDGGIDNDQRYEAKYRIKAAPIGFSYSMDYERFGFIVSPGIFTIGQDNHIVNTLGGHDGVRTTNLSYVSLPVSLKYHIIDLEFFRVSAVAAITGAFLYDASDKITHTYSKLKFPIETYPILPESYIKEYDGVFAPQTNNLSIAEKQNYNSTQLFVGLGLRSDWDVSNHWRVSLDIRINYGLLDPRNDEYKAAVQAYESIYETPGKRRDVFTHVSIGFSRFLDFDKGDRDRNKKLNGGSKPFSSGKKSGKKRSRPK